MEFIKNLFNGTIIGIANIIPGVSGGTMALVLGFYERLIKAIHNISLETAIISIRALSFKGENIQRFKDELKRIDAYFLFAITTGALAAIAALADLMTYLLKNQHDPTYGFFFGLVLVSAVSPYRLIKKKTFLVLLSFLLSAAAVVLISLSVSDEDIINKARVKQEMKSNLVITDDAGTEIKSGKGFTRSLYFFFMGAVAISAMILPGVSGSFLMLLMGGYFEILKAISGRDIIFLSVFALGCCFGILAFSRLLNYLLSKWHDITMSSLLGLVAGSLWMIWPFKRSAIVGGDIIYLSNRIPEHIQTAEITAGISAAAGMIIVMLLIRIEKLSGDSIP